MSPLRSFLGNTDEIRVLDLIIPIGFTQRVYVSDIERVTKIPHAKLCKILDRLVGPDGVDLSDMAYIELAKNNKALALHNVIITLHIEELIEAQRKALEG